MDHSQELEKKNQSSGCNKVRWLVVAIVTLAISLVAVTIVMTLMSTKSLPGQRDIKDHEEGVTVSRSVHGGKENIDATINFYHKSDVEIIVTREGELTATLYDLGLQVTNDATTGECYVMKVNTSAVDGKNEESLIESASTVELDVTATTLIRVRSRRPMISEELTILPQFVRNHCKEDTYWVREEMEEKKGLQRTKRQFWRKLL